MNSLLAKNICLATNQGEKNLFTLASLGRKSFFHLICGKKYTYTDHSTAELYLYIEQKGFRVNPAFIPAVVEL